MRFSLRVRSVQSFTLLELLIVIGILAVLASVSFIALNPVEQLRKARDSQRLADLRSLNNSLAIYESQTLNPVMGSSTKIYLSLPDTSSSCASYSLPPAPSGYSYACVTETNLRKTNGSGWVPVNLAGLEIGSPLAKLPVDPTNNSQYYYTYTTGGSFMLTGLMESTNNKVADQAINDGGRMPGVFELGSNLNLGPFTRDKGLVGYWTFDEGTGTTAYDYSGNNNTGTLTNGPTWQTSTNCKKGGCLLFDGVDDYVMASDSPSLDITPNFSTGAWIKADLFPTFSSILSKAFQGSATTFNYGFWSYSGGTVRGAIGDGINYNLGDYSSSLSTGQWYYVIFTVDGSKLKLFINGQLDRSTLQTVTPAVNNYNVYIGSDSSNSYRFDGTIDEVRIYNRALSEAEIKAIYEATR
ncbi:MAG: LamG-like jellyroll fold domain-containing protein [Patescibacteria group bacterium]